MHQKVKPETNIKVIKLINGDDIVCNLPQKELQLPDISPLLRFQVRSIDILDILKNQFNSLAFFLSSNF